MASRRDFPSCFTTAGPIRNILLGYLDENAVLNTAIASPKGENIAVITAAVRAGRTLNNGHSILYAGLLVSNWKEVVKIVEEAGGVFNRHTDLSWLPAGRVLPDGMNLTKIKPHLVGRWQNRNELLRRIVQAGSSIVPILARAFPDGLTAPRPDPNVVVWEWNPEKPFYGAGVLATLVSVLVKNQSALLRRRPLNLIKQHANAITFLVEQGTPLGNDTLRGAILASVLHHVELDNSMRMVATVCEALGPEGVNKVYSVPPNNSRGTDLQRLIAYDVNAPEENLHSCFLAAKTLIEHGANVNDGRFPSPILIWYLVNLYRYSKTLENRGPMIRLLWSKSDAAALARPITAVREGVSLTGTAETFLLLLSI